MPNDIFGNQDIGQGQSAVQAAQPISNTSKATAIEGLQYTEPLIGKLAEGAVKKADDYSGVQAQNLVNLRNRLFALEQSRKTTGGIKTDAELRVKQFQETQRFVDANPHMREDVDKLVRETNDIYKFSEADPEAKGMQKAQEDLTNKVRTLGLVAKDETNPAVLEAGIQSYQRLEATMQQNKVLADQIALQQAQLNLRSTVRDQSKWPTQDQMELMKNNEAMMIYNLKMNSNLISQEGNKVTGNAVRDVLSLYGDKLKDPNMKALAVRSLEEIEQNARKFLQQQPGFSFLSIQDQQKMEDDIVGKVKIAKDMLVGDTDVKIIENTNSMLEKSTLYNTFTGPYGDKAKKSKVMTTLFGNNAFTASLAQETSTLILASDQKTAAGNEVPQSLFILPQDPAKYEAWRTVLSTPDKIAAQANSSEGDVQKHFDEQMYNLTDTIMAGLKPDKDGKTDPQAIQQVLEQLGADNYNAWAVRTKPEYSGEMRKQVGDAIRQQHSMPAFAAASTAINKELPTGKSVGDYIQLVWQDGGIVAKSKVGAGVDQLSVDLAIQKFNKISGGLSAIVRADATLQNSNDFQAVLDGYSKVFYGVENISNTPVKGSTQTSKDNQAKVNAKNDLQYLMTQPDAPVSSGGAPISSRTYGNVSEEDINQILQANPGATREEVMQFLQEQQ